MYSRVRVVKIKLKRFRKSERELRERGRYWENLIIRKRAIEKKRKKERER